MPVDFTAREDRPAADPNGSAFAPVPTFARPTRGKGRRRGKAETAEPAAAVAPEAMAARTEAMMNAPPATPMAAEFAAGGDFTPRPRASRKLPTAVLIAAPAAVLLAGAAYLATQPRGEPVNPPAAGPAPIQTTEATQGPVNPMPEIAPPAPTPMAAQAAPKASAAATPAPRETRTARARPAPRAPAAEDSAAEASATAPSPPRDRSDLVVNPAPVAIPPIAAPPTPSTAPQTPADLPPTTPIPEISGDTREVLPDSSASTP
jgi:hypothetical protein